MQAAIPSCDRPTQCLMVTHYLGLFDEVHVFVNNCDFGPYLLENWPDNVILHNWTDITGEPKLCHNTTFKKMIMWLSESKDVLFIEDDVVPSKNFDVDFINIFTMLKTKYCKHFAFSPIWIPEKKCRYTNAPEHDIVYFGWDLFTQVYIDGNFAITAEVLQDFKRLVKSRHFPVLKSNSGISPVLSKYMAAMDWPMICRKPSMLGHGDHDSIQFPEGRRRVPLIAVTE